MDVSEIVGNEMRWGNMYMMRLDEMRWEMGALR